MEPILTKESCLKSNPEEIYSMPTQISVALFVVPFRTRGTGTIGLSKKWDGAITLIAFREEESYLCLVKRATNSTQVEVSAEC